MKIRFADLLSLNLSKISSLSYQNSYLFFSCPLNLQVFFLPNIYLILLLPLFFILYSSTFAGVLVSTLISMLCLLVNFLDNFRQAGIIKMNLFFRETSIKM